MFVDVGSARLFFDVIGPQLDPVGPAMAARPTLILLHGGPGFDHSTLRPYFDRYADTHQVIYLDHRGCGRSSGAQETWFLDQWADDLAVFCDRLGIEKPVIFGQSFGGMVAMHYAARHPDGPSKLVLSSTAAQFRLDATMDMMRRLGGDYPAEVAQQFFTAPTLERFRVYGEVCLPLYSSPDAPDAAAFRDRAIQKPEVAVHFFQGEMMDMDMRERNIAHVIQPHDDHPCDPQRNDVATGDQHVAGIEII